MVYSLNDYLSQAQMEVNADYLMSELSDLGWSKTAICGMLGNMETESTINPGIWQSLNEGNMSGGFGLVQWTPASKFTNWADSKGYPWGDIDGQISRILWEVANNEQWISTSSYPLSFKQFTTSNESPEYLAQAFLLNYERPDDKTQPQRSTQARKWFDLLEGGGSGGKSKPAFPTTEGLAITSPYGWRIHPIEGINKFHGAIDIGGGDVNHPIYATQNGVVIYNQSTSYGGWTIRLRHTSDPYYSQYQHMSVKSPITIGTSVTKGQMIGTMGTTGDSTGIHLDFAIAINETGWFTESGTIDPELYLEMMFGGGGGEKDDNLMSNLITLLLVDALNGWKY